MKTGIKSGSKHHIRPGTKPGTQAGTPRAITRRSALAQAAGIAGVIAAAGWVVPGWASDGWRLRRRQTPAPWLQLRAAPEGGWHGIDPSGQLWHMDLGGQLRALGDGLDPQAPLAAAHGRVVARRQDGRLWVGDGAQLTGQSDVELATHAGFLVLPLAVIAVAGSGLSAHLVRLEPNASGRWQVVSRSAQPVLPDARPVQVDVDGRGDGGHVAVLAGPDRDRYGHAVLGDDIEATRLQWLERHSLAVLRELTLPAPDVFEDVGVRVWGTSSRGAGLVTMRSGPRGSQLVLIEADLRQPGALRVAAAGAPIGTRLRWMSASNYGDRLVAVHTPHIGGVLHRYRRQGDRLEAQPVMDGVSNHAIGSRELDASVWLNGRMLLADRSGRQLRVVDTERGNVDAILGVDAPMRDFSRQTDGSRGALLADGVVVEILPPGAS